MLCELLAPVLLASHCAASHARLSRSLCCRPGPRWGSFVMSQDERLLDLGRGKQGGWCKKMSPFWSTPQPLGLWFLNHLAISSFFTLLSLKWMWLGAVAVMWFPTKKPSGIALRTQSSTVEIYWNVLNYLRELLMSENGSIVEAYTPNSKFDIRPGLSQKTHF